MAFLGGLRQDRAGQQERPGGHGVSEVRTRVAVEWDMEVLIKGSLGPTCPSAHGSWVLRYFQDWAGLSATHVNRCVREENYNQIFVVASPTPSLKRESALFVGSQPPGNYCVMKGERLRCRVGEAERGRIDPFEERWGSPRGGGLLWEIKEAPQGAEKGRAE